MPRAPAPDKSAGHLYAHLIPDWLPEENDGYTLFDFTGANPYRGNWTCRVCGHKWGTAISNRTLRGSACPKCKRKSIAATQRGVLRKVPFERSVAHLAPDLLPYWHPTKNEGLTAYDVYAHANRWVWWLCPEGHETYAMINSKVLGFECKDCSKSSKSAVEDAVRAELMSVFNLAPKATSIPVRWRNRAKAEVDMLGTLPDGSPIVLEFDGEYHHDPMSFPDVGARDLAKTEALLAAGYTVVRIRQLEQAHLQLQHARLFQLNFRFPRTTNDYVAELPRLRADIEQLLGL